MGAGQSKPTTNNTKNECSNDLMCTLNKIAANYITTSSYQDLLHLNKIDKCEDLLTVTSTALQQNLNKKQIEFLVGKLNVSDDKSSLEKTQDSSSENTKKCQDIAKFFVKIGHLYSAILGTIYPVQVCDDKSYYGTTVKTPLLDIKKHTDPCSQISRRSSLMPGETKDNYVNLGLKRDGLCSRRIQALINNQNIFKKGVDEPITIHPRICNFNVDKSSSRSMGLSSRYMSSSYDDSYDDSNDDRYTKVLGYEKGIGELEKLYYDVFDPATGKFTKMSKEAKQQYESDLEEFYKVFSGKTTDIPMTIENKKAITNFSNIPLKNLHDLKECKQTSSSKIPVFKQSYSGIISETSVNAGLFKSYAEHLKKMMDNSNKSQNDLLQILTEVFAFEETTETKETKKTITIKEMTYDDLNNLIVKARNIIVKMYLQCERDFEKGILIFRAITELVQQKTLDKQTDSLSSIVTTENMHDMLMNKLSDTTNQLNNAIQDYLNYTDNPNEPSDINEVIQLKKIIEQNEKRLQEEFHDTAHKTNIPATNIEIIRSIITQANDIIES